MSIVAVTPCNIVSGQPIMVRKYLSMQATNEMIARVDKIIVKKTSRFVPFRSRG